MGWGGGGGMREVKEMGSRGKRWATREGMHVVVLHVCNMLQPCTIHCRVVCAC